MKFIKTLVGGILLAGLMGVALELTFNEDVEVINESAEEETIEEVLPADWITEAEAAREAVIARKRLEKELAELDVIKASTTARMTEIEKELNIYWREKSNVVKLIRDTFPEEPKTAIAVANCESGLNPKAYNPNNSNGSTDGGLWQINSVHDKRLDELGLDKFNPEDATEFARMLYEKNGWNDWVCYWHPDHLAMR